MIDLKTGVIGAIGLYAAYQVYTAWTSDASTAQTPRPATGTPISDRPPTTSEARREDRAARAAQGFKPRIGV